MKRLFFAFLLLLPAAAGFGAPLTTLGAQNGDTSGGNYTADALRYAARTQLAFVISSDLRDFTSADEPSGEELVSLIAIKSDKVYSMILTGEQIGKALKKAFFLYPRANPAFLHLSGMRVVLKDHGVKTVEVASGDGWEPLADRVLYSVAMSQSLAEGVLGYWKLWSIEDAEEESMTMGDIIPLYFAEQDQKDPFEKRITTEEDQ